MTSHTYSYKEISIGSGANELPSDIHLQHHFQRPRPRSVSGSSSLHIPTIPAIPDLRFEYSYLKSISRHVQTKPLPLRDGEDDGLVKYEIVGVDWRKVLWITTRDQLLSPFLQGAVWGLAQLFVRPLFSSIGSLFGFSRKRAPKPKIESEFSKRMREWARSLKP